MLAMTEEVTFTNKHVAEATYQQAVAALSEQYLAQVLMAIVAINAWTA
ncbi:hypothetical protein [Hymenobacter coccineus]|nr:hypothetical protein [Hymenobacter coccineus]